MRWLGIDLPVSCPYLTCVVLPADEVGDPTDKEHLLISAIECIQMAIDRIFSGVVFRSLAGELICLLPISGAHPSFIDRLDEFLEYVPTALTKERLGRFGIGVGIEVADIGKTDRSYETARIALEQRFFESESQIFYADLSESFDTDQPKIHREDLRLVRHAISGGNEALLRITVDELFESAVSSGARDVKQIHSIGFRLLYRSRRCLG